MLQGPRLVPSTANRKGSSAWPRLSLSARTQGGESWPGQRFACQGNPFFPPHYEGLCPGKHGASCKQGGFGFVPKEKRICLLQEPQPGSGSVVIPLSKGTHVLGLQECCLGEKGISSSLRATFKMHEDML